LEPEISSRIVEMESSGRVPDSLIDSLRTIGIFRMFVPAEAGGLELDFPSALTIIRTIRRTDASIGWLCGISGLNAIFATHVPRGLYDRVYSRGPDVLIAGAAQPAGRAEPDSGGGFRVTGRWPYASGCVHADWIQAFSVVADARADAAKKQSDVPDAPVITGLMAPASRWGIDDTWHVLGMKGTGSHHISLNDQHFSDEYFFDPAGGALFDGPLYQSPLHFLPLLHAAMSIGVAEAAMDDLVHLANTGLRQWRAAKPLGESEQFQIELGRLEAGINAARAYYEAQLDVHWQRAQAKTLNDKSLHTRGIQAAAWIAATCVKIADTCFALGGASTVYEASPLQRRLRDLRVMTQHAIVQPRQYASVGELLLSTSRPAAQG
jgi:alkylation response protein AidB-like acyl-CoA dehydrogenase